MKPILVDRDGNNLGDLYVGTSGNPILPRVGEHVSDGNGELVVFRVRWDFELEEIQVFVTPIPTEEKSG